MCCPAAIDRENGAGDGGGLLGRKKSAEAGDLVHFDKAFRRLRREKNIPYYSASLTPRAFAVSGICFSTSGVLT
jgi:hypothetical protein